MIPCFKVHYHIFQLVQTYIIFDKLSLDIQNYNLPEINKVFCVLLPPGQKKHVNLPINTKKTFLSLDIYLANGAIFLQILCRFQVLIYFCPWVRFLVPGLTRAQHWFGADKV